MTETIQLISLRAKWKKILRGKPTTNDLKDYVRDLERHQSYSKVNTQVA